MSQRRRIIVVVAAVAVGLILWGGRMQMARHSLVPAFARAEAEAAPSWESDAQKWVPIFSVQNTTVRLGAAQIAGPRRQVDQTKAVAQLQLHFRGIARVRVYIPVRSISTRLDRVQGVAVWATADLRVLSL
jgi:hypothetical protein